MFKKTENGMGSMLEVTDKKHSFLLNNTSSILSEKSSIFLLHLMRTRGPQEVLQKRIPNFEGQHTTFSLNKNYQKNTNITP